MKKRPVPTKESARTGVVHSIAFMSDLQVTQDGEYVKIANTLDANLRALDTAIQSGGQQTDYSLTIQTPASPDASYAAQYEFRQCGDVLATINIPKDMVVQEGSVVDITFSEDRLYDGQTDVTEKIKGAGVTPTEADAGKYVKLVIANKTDSTLYIKATDLVDVYTAQQSAAQVQLAISNANEISATIVAGSIGTTELSTEVNASLAKAGTALQASDVVSTYDAESTAPVNGVAVAAAISNSLKESDLDGTTIEKDASNGVQVKDGAITTAKLANLASFNLIDSETGDVYMVRIANGRMEIVGLAPDEPEAWAVVHYEAPGGGAPAGGEYGEDTITFASINEIIASEHYPVAAYKSENGEVSIKLNGQSEVDLENGGWFTLFTIDSNKTISDLGISTTEAYLVTDTPASP